MADVYIRFGVIYVTRIDLIKKKGKERWKMMAVKLIEILPT